MSVPATAIRKMADLGISAADIAEICELIDAGGVPDTLTKRREYDRNRKAEMRKSGGKSGRQNADTSGGMSTGNLPDTSVLARVKDITPLTEISGKEERKLSKGSRLSDEWIPTETDEQFALTEGLTTEEIKRATDEFRDYWRSLSGSKSCRGNWSLTWRNRIREIADRKRQRQARMGNGSPPGGNGQGITSFVDIIAERRSRAGH